MLQCGRALSASSQVWLMLIWGWICLGINEASIGVMLWRSTYIMSHFETGDVTFLLTFWLQPGEYLCRTGRWYRWLPASWPWWPYWMGCHVLIFFNISARKKEVANERGEMINDYARLGKMLKVSQSLCWFLRNTLSSKPHALPMLWLSSV